MVRRCSFLPGSYAHAGLKNTTPPSSRPCFLHGPNTQAKFHRLSLESRPTQGKTTNSRGTLPPTSTFVHLIMWTESPSPVHHLPQASHHPPLPPHHPRAAFGTWSTPELLLRLRTCKLDILSADAVRFVVLGDDYEGKPSKRHMSWRLTRS